MVRTVAVARSQQANALFKKKEKSMKTEYSELRAMGRLDRLINEIPEADRPRILAWLFDKHGAQTPGTGGPLFRTADKCRAVPLVSPAGS